MHRAQTNDPRRLCIQAYARGARDNLSAIFVYTADRPPPPRVLVPDWAAEVEPLAQSGTDSVRDT